MTLTLSGELNVQRAGDVRVEIAAAVRAAQLEQQPLLLDLAEVTEIDSAGVQLLLMARREARAQGSDVVIVRRSPVVEQVFELLSLDQHLDGDIVVEFSS